MDIPYLHCLEFADPPSFLKSPVLESLVSSLLLRSKPMYYKLFASRGLILFYTFRIEYLLTIKSYYRVYLV